MSIITAKSCSAADIQAAIDATQSGDTVIVPAGVAIWASPVTIPNTKGITLDGSGTLLTGKLYLQQNATTSSRVMGFNFITPTTVPYAANDLSVSGNPTSAPFRVDHCSFKSTTGGSILIETYGNAPGLFDHNKFYAPTNSEMIHQMGLGASNDAGWHDDIKPGDWRQVYFEDNEFINNDPSLQTTNPAYYWGNSGIQGYYGARTVLRHNTFSMSHIDMHGGSLGARWWEIYENTFLTVLNGNQDRFIGMRHGSGVIFNNRVVLAPNFQGGYLTLGFEGPDSPIYKVGRGKDLTLDPAYVWGNDPTMKFGAGAELTLNVDYYLSAKPGYVPFVYPYPLDANGLPNPTGVAPIPIPIPPIPIPPTPAPADNPPIPGGSGALSVSSLSSSSLMLEWLSASDDKPGLLYEVRRSYADNMSTVALAEQNGVVLKPYTALLTQFKVSGLKTYQIPYFTVIVKDSAGQKAIYRTVSARYGWSSL